MSRKKEKIPGALVKNISKKKKGKKVVVPEVVVTNFGGAGGILQTMLHAQMLGEGSSAVLVDQILDLLLPLSFKVMRINWKQQTAIVDGKKMTIKEAKRRGFINKDGSTTTTEQGQLVVSSF